MPATFTKDLQYRKFCTYGFLKNLRFFEPFMLLFLLEKDLSYLQVGTLLAIQEITINLFEIPTGVLADALGRRKSLIQSFVFYIISFIIYYYSTSFGTLIIAALFFGYGDAFRTGTHKAMIFEYLKLNGWSDQKVHYYGHTRSWSQKGSALSAIIAAIIVYFHGEYKSVFLFSIVPYLLDLWLITTYPKSLDGKKTKIIKGEIYAQFRSTLNDFLTSFKNRAMLGAILSQAVYTGYYKAVKDYLQPIINLFAISLPLFLWMNQQQRSSILVGLIYSLIYLLTSYTSKNSGRFTDRFGNVTTPLNITMIIGLVLGILCGVMYTFRLEFISIILFSGIYLVENLRKPIGISAVADNLKKDVLASALSAESQAETLFAALIAPLIGLFADLWGVGYALILVSVMLLLLHPLYRARKTITKANV